MIRADSINTTSRRGFLAKTTAFAAAGALAAGPAFAANPDAEIIAAGAKFEALLSEYIYGWFEWARLHRAGRAQVYAKFGHDEHNAAWTQPNLGKSPAMKYLTQVLGENGTRAASDAQAALWEPMELLADLIRETDVESLAGLRSKTFVALWDCLPLSTEHDGSLSFEDEYLRSLFNGAVAVTGLSEFVSSVCERFKNDATEEVS